MAYLFRRKRVHCFTCKRGDVPLYLLHNNCGSALGILCGEHAGAHMDILGTTASPLGNLRQRPRRRRRGHPIAG